MTPQGWTIEPSIYRGFTFGHENYQWDSYYGGNGLCGFGHTRKHCLEQIADIEAEHEYFRKEAE